MQLTCFYFASFFRCEYFYFISRSSSFIQRFINIYQKAHINITSTICSYMYVCFDVICANILSSLRDYFFVSRLTECIAPHAIFLVCSRVCFTRWRTTEHLQFSFNVRCRDNKTVKTCIFSPLLSSGSCLGRFSQTVSQAIYFYVSFHWNVSSVAHRLSSSRHWKLHLSDNENVWFLFRFVCK